MEFSATTVDHVQTKIAILISLHIIHHTPNHSMSIFGPSITYSRSQKPPAPDRKKPLTPRYKGLRFYKILAADPNRVLSGAHDSCPDRRSRFVIRRPCFAIYILPACLCGTFAFWLFLPINLVPIPLYPLSPPQAPFSSFSAYWSLEPQTSSSISTSSPRRPKVERSLEGELKLKEAEEPRSEERLS